MPSEWYNGGYWDGIPIRRLGHVAADLVREANRRRDGSPMHPYSDDPADYDGMPVRELGAVAETALAWLRKECTDYAYPDFIEDATSGSSWAYVQGETSTDIVTEEYLGIDGLEVDGERVCGQIWHLLRRAIEALRWQMRIEFSYPLDVKAPGSPWVANSQYLTSFSEDAADVDEAVTELNSNLWPTSGPYTVDGASRFVTWSATSCGWNAITLKATASISGSLVRSKQSDLSYYDEIVRAGFAYDTQAPLVKASFTADGAGPYTDSGATRSIVWLATIPSTSTFQLDYGDGLPVTFSNVSGSVSPAAARRDTRITLLFVRDMEYTAS